MGLLVIYALTHDPTRRGGTEIARECGKTNRYKRPLYVLPFVDQLPSAHPAICGDDSKERLIVTFSSRTAGTVSHPPKSGKIARSSFPRRQAQTLRVKQQSTGTSFLQANHKFECSLLLVGLKERCDQKTASIAAANKKGQRRRFLLLLTGRWHELSC